MGSRFIRNEAAREGEGEREREGGGGEGEEGVERVYDEDMQWTSRRGTYYRSSKDIN